MSSLYQSFHFRFFLKILFQLFFNCMQQFTHASYHTCIIFNFCIYIENTFIHSYQFSGCLSSRTSVLLTKNFHKRIFFLCRNLLLILFIKKNFWFKVCIYLTWNKLGIVSAILIQYSITTNLNPAITYFQQIYHLVWSIGVFVKPIA